MGYGNLSVTDLLSEQLGKGLTLKEIETGGPFIRTYGNPGDLKLLALRRKAFIFFTKGFYMCNTLRF